MTEGSKTRILSRQTMVGDPAIGGSAGYTGAIFSCTLSDGRVVTIREMAAKDLLFMEKSLGKMGDMERGMKMVERLSLGDNAITFPELSNLSLKDFRKVTALLNEAGGMEDEDELEAEVDLGED